MYKKYKRPVPKNEVLTGRKSKTIPSQSMGIKEILERFTRHPDLPLNTQMREPVYDPQMEEDLEKLSRMDFAEKYDFVEQTKQRLEAMKEALAEEEREQREINERELREKLKAEWIAEQKAGIGALDNTMPVDTKLRNS